MALAGAHQAQWAERAARTTWMEEAAANCESDTMTTRLTGTEAYPGTAKGIAGYEIDKRVAVAEYFPLHHQ